MGLKLRNGLWHVDIRTATGRHRETTGTADKRLAQVKHAEIERALLLGERAGRVSKGMSLQEVADRVMALVWKGTKGEQTAAKNIRDVIAALPPGILVSEIDSDHFELLVDVWTAQGLKPQTQDRKFAALSKVLTMATRWKIMEHAPRVPMSAQYVGRLRTLTEVEVQQAMELFRKTPKARYMEEAVVPALLDTGMRLGELLKLTKEDVRGAQVTIWGSKGDISRTLPLTARAASALMMWMALPVRPTKDMIEHRWTDMRRALGLQDDKQFVIHALRHTCCSRLVRAGMDLRRVQAWMGHRAIQTTIKYAHVDTKDLEALASVLSSVLS